MQVLFSIDVECCISQLNPINLLCQFVYHCHWVLLWSARGCYTGLGLIWTFTKSFLVDALKGPPPHHYSRKYQDTVTKGLTLKYRMNFCISKIGIFSHYQYSASSDCKLWYGKKILVYYKLCYAKCELFIRLFANAQVRNKTLSSSF